MKKKFKALIFALFFTFCVLCNFSACKDYGYEFRFSVVGENGKIIYRWKEGGGDEWNEQKSPVFLKGNKNGQQIELTAIPDEGYRVKQWVCNGTPVEDNKTNSFVAVATDNKHNVVIVTVEFELITNNNSLLN